MNEELQKALGDLLGKTNKGIDAASDFLASELPEVIQQLLLWHGIYNFIVFIGCLIIPFLCYKASMSAAKKTFLLDGKDYFDYPHILIPMIFINFFVFIFSIASINIEWLQIWIAPKVWLLEYAAKLTN